MECGGLPPLSRSSMCADKTLHARLAARAKKRQPGTAAQASRHDATGCNASSHARATKTLNV